MKIEVQIVSGTPHSLVMHCVDQMAENLKLFEVGTAVVTFEDGEEDRLIRNELNRDLRIK